MQVSFALPSASSGQYPKLFAQLDSLKADLGIRSYGIAGAAIEDVFLKAGQEHTPSDNAAVQRRTGAPREAIALKTATLGTFIDPNSWRAMFLKRWCNLKRNHLAIVPQLIVPSAFVLFVSGVAVVAHLALFVCSLCMTQHWSHFLYHLPVQYGHVCSGCCSWNRHLQGECCILHRFLSNTCTLR